MVELEYREVADALPYHSAIVSVGGRGVALHSHRDFYEVVHVLEGRGWHRVGREVLPLDPKQVVLVRPQDSHAFSSRPGDTLRLLNTAFPSGTWHGLLELAGLSDAAGWSRPPLPIPVSDSGELSEMALSLLSSCYGSPSKVELLEFLLALAALLRQRAPSEDAQPQWLARACAAMDSEDNARAGLSRFTEIAAVSPSHLARTMRQFHGCTPVQFVAERRLALAAAALASSVEPVSQISSRLGFHSHAYFSRCFRERYGLTPREYRARARRMVVPT